MRVAAGVIGLVFGLISITYVAFYGAMIGSVVGWLSPTNSSAASWAEMVRVLSWICPLLAIAGGAFCFRHPGFGGSLLLGSAFCHYQLMGFGSIGNIFIFTPAVAAFVAFASIGSDHEAKARRQSSESNQSAPEAHADPAVISTIPASSTSSPTVCPYDVAKWNALAEYDSDISPYVEQIRPLGQKWMEEFASAYMALGDKSYLPSIFSKIQQRVATEQREQQEREELARIKSAQTKAEADERATAEQEQVILAKQQRQNELHSRREETIEFLQQPALLVGGVVLAIALLGGSYLIYRTVSSHSQTANAQQNGGPTSQAQAVPTMFISMQNNSLLSVNDFIHNGPGGFDFINPTLHNYILASSNPGFQSPKGHYPPVKQVTPFSILYFADGSSFLISLDQLPLGDTRAAAEKFLQIQLGISETRMCGLKYQVLTNVHVSQAYAGRDLRFGFCAGATRFRRGE